MAFPPDTRIVFFTSGRKRCCTTGPVVISRVREKSKNPATKKIARERISVLFDQAGRAFHDHPERSNRYVELARKIAMRQRIRIDREFRRRFCHHCYVYLVPGNNMRVRVHRSNVVVTCHACNKKTRYRVVRPLDGNK